MRKKMEIHQLHIIAGGAGFIGINLARHLLSNTNNSVAIFDNHSNAHSNELSALLDDIKYENRLHSIKVDIADYEDLREAWSILKKRMPINIGGTERPTKYTIWHLAANSDIPSGIEDPTIDLRDTFMTTFNLLKLCGEEKIKRFIFASSSAIYGDHGELSISETTAPLMPISNYGAMKLASEAICYAAKHDFLESLFVFRFPNVVGTPATHGVIYDFINKLKSNPATLEVLGNGSQKKSYLHVSDLVNAMTHLSGIEITNGEPPIFNLGPANDSITVREIAECVRDTVSSTAAIKYGTTPYGWKGDIPRFEYNISKALSYGWKPKLNSQDAIRLAVTEIVNQH